jgi:iron-sulfur cluster assembly protein
MSITVSESAARRIHEMRAQHPQASEQAGLRIGVKGGGCAGYTYILEFEEAPRPTDQVFEKDGAKVYCDPRSLEILSGTELDFEKSFMQQRFIFKNPHTKSTCGCGESFAV